MEPRVLRKLFCFQKHVNADMFRLVENEPNQQHFYGRPYTTRLICLICLVPGRTCTLHNSVRVYNFLRFRLKGTRVSIYKVCTVDKSTSACTAVGTFMPFQVKQMTEFRFLKMKTREYQVNP